MNSGEVNMRMMTGLGILAGLALVCGPATATTSINSTFAVQLTIHAECVINSTSTLNFGSLGVLGGSGGTANNDSTATVAVQCTDTTPFDIGLDAGTTTGGSTTTRKLLNQAQGSTATVNYTLWQDAGHTTTNWGNQVGTDTMSLTGDGTSHTYTVYGRIPPQMTPAPGTYADTITVTVTY
jgi:spore coat protein U-like protein